MTTVIASSDCMVRLTVQVHMFILYVHMHACTSLYIHVCLLECLLGNIYLDVNLSAIHGQLWVLPFGHLNERIEGYEHVRRYLHKVRAPSRNLNAG